MEDRVVVVGGANMDIGGRSAAPLLRRDSNPGRVRLSPGGVGRNIAHNLALLGCGVTLLTAFGDDLYGGELSASCAGLGIDVSHALTVPGGRTSTYLYIAGDDGDMALAVSDMDICAQIAPAYLERERAVLERAGAVVADANLPAESLLWLCEHVKAPVFADPVSAAKAGRLAPALGRVHTLKPNRLEASALSGVEIADEKSLERAAKTLLDTGLGRVFISLGGEGVYAAGGGEPVRLPALPARVVNATGAGDAFMAALAWAYLNGASLRRSAALAQAAAALAAECPETVEPRLTPALVLERAASLL